MSLNDFAIAYAKLSHACAFAVTPEEIYSADWDMALFIHSL